MRACVLLTLVLLAACAPWARGPRVSPVESGLLGEWIGPVSLGADTTLWRFAADGKLVQVQIKPAQQLRETPFGPFRVYADTGRRQLICFSFRRGRTLPACRYFQVDTLIQATGETHRQLRLLDWVDEKRGTQEIWIEKTPSLTTPP